MLWLTIWHAFCHFLGTDYSLTYGVWNWYDFWSGICGSFVMNAIVWLLIWWRAFSCHRAWWCLRHGKYDLAGGKWKLCAKHHPDIPSSSSWGEKLRHHQQWKAREAS